MTSQWRGVVPAVTAPFRPNQPPGLAATRGPIEARLDAGIDGLVMLETVVENSALEPPEKREVMKPAIEQVRVRVMVPSGVAVTTTRLA